MIALIDHNRAAIADLCRQYGVQKLAVFGSAVNGTFHDESDLDFVLEMAEYGPGVSERFILFANSLEELFGRDVDLVFETRLTDSVFRKNVLSTMEVIFDDGDRRQAVA